MTYLLPIVYALFIWWFSTGIIFYLDGLPVRTFKWSMLGGTALLAASLLGLLVSASDTSVGGAYIAFTCGVLAWGWQEMSLYMGYVTGPRKHRCREGCSGWGHFIHAVEANLWHELSIIAAAIIIIAMCWDGANTVGMWTFLTLWGLHLSARLNVFLGVRNVSEEFVPEHMAVLKGFLTRKPMNLLFPLSVTGATVGAVLLFLQAHAASDEFEITGFLFLGTMMALALIEHWFLMLPLPVEKLWQWSLSSSKKKGAASDHTEKAASFNALKTAQAR